MTNEEMIAEERLMLTWAMLVTNLTGYWITYGHCVPFPTTIMTTIITIPTLTNRDMNRSTTSMTGKGFQGIMSEEVTAELVPVEEAPLATVSPQELITQLEQEIFDDFIYFHEQSKKWELTAKGYRWVASKFRVRFGEIDIEIVGDYYEATCSAFSEVTGTSAYGSAVQLRIVKGRIDETARAKVTTKCGRNGIKNVVPPNIFETLIKQVLSKRGTQQPPQERKTPPTTNRSRAMAASAYVIQQLDRHHGITKEGMWDYFRKVYNVASRKEFDPNGKEWGEIANRLTNASKNRKALDKLAEDIGA